MHTLHFSNETVANLSHDQEAAVRLITEHPGGYGVACLTGAAGTGKTFTTKRIVESTDREVILTATTNKAARVLSEATGQQASTIHRALLLTMQRSPITGHQELVQREVPQLPHGGLLIVDEASMVDEDLLGYILQAAELFDVFVLFVGDHCQVPPVGKDPELFNGRFAHIKLSTIHRQALGNPIIALASQYRDLIEGNTEALPEIVTALNDDGAGVEVVSRQVFRTRIAEAFNQSYGDDIKVCAYTNKCALKHNYDVRAAIYGVELADDEPIMVGERLVVCKPVLGGGDKVLLAVEDEVVVSSLRSAVHRPSGVTGVEIPFGSEVVLFVPDDLIEANNYVEELRKQAMKATRQHKVTATMESDSARRAAWRKFFKADRAFHDLRHGYASTTHKAQGSTFNTVFIDLPDLMTCRDTALRNRLFYTALTRASHRVVINGGAQ